MDMQQTLDDFRPIANFSRAVAEHISQLKALTFNGAQLTEVRDPVFPNGTRVLVAGRRDADPRCERDVVFTGTRRGYDGVWCVLRDPQGMTADVIDKQCFLKRAQPNKPIRQQLMVTDEKRAAYRMLLNGMDWLYQYAEDNRIWSENQRRLAAILAEQPTVDPEHVIWNACVPRHLRKKVAA